MTTSASDLTNALALIDTAVRAIRQAEPAMVRYLIERSLINPESPEDTAVWAAVEPIFRTAIDLLEDHELHITAARAALKKVTER